MDRLANLEKVLKAVRSAVADADWGGAERLCERLMSSVLDAALADDRPALDRMRERLAAFRSATARQLDASDPAQLAVSALLRADATLAAIAARMRPEGLAPAKDATIRSGAERVLHYLARRPSGATTGEIASAADLAAGTVSRVLTDLKARGLATSRDAGRFVVSRLTPRGQALAGGRGPALGRRSIANALTKPATTMQPIVNRARPETASVEEFFVTPVAGRTTDLFDAEAEGLSDLVIEEVPLTPIENICMPMVAAG